MQFTIATIAATLLAATTTANGAVLPPRQDGSTPSTTRFQLLAVRSDSDGVHHYDPLGASKSSFLLRLPSQNATCDGGVSSGDMATFYIGADSEYSTTGLFMHTSSGSPAQEAWVDRSGMGQGAFHYTTGTQPIGRNGERGPWAIDGDGHLTFAGNAGFIACPTTAVAGAWSVWVAAGTDKPGFNEGCVSVALKTLEVGEPVGCEYTY